MNAIRRLLCISAGHLFIQKVVTFIPSTTFNSFSAQRSILSLPTSHMHIYIEIKQQPDIYCDNANWQIDC